ncbi:MAG TPA: type II secretion system F family protein [Gemmatimonadaceae bacterium]|nr:type II secretion system F family protein [Gemmatimonadaceae bacterium]
MIGAGAGVFAFRAVTSDGSIDAGTVDAATAADARAIVAARGLFVLTIESRGLRRERRDPLSAADAALGLRVLADLLESGLSVSRALATFQDLAPRGWKAALPHIQQSVREGKSLAAALAAAPLEIPALVIGIAHAGEAGGGIGPAIRRAAELTEATAEMQSAVRSALAYPAVVAFAGVMAIVVLLTVVLPRFARILADLGQRLPASTQFVLRISDVGRVALLPAVIGGVILFAIWRSWSQTESGRIQWHKLLLAIPFLGSVRRSTATARMAHSLSALLDSGVPIASAIGFAAQASGDAAMFQRLIGARGSIIAGQSLSQALEACGATDVTTVKLVRAGEESGRLSGMLSHAAKIEQKRADSIIRTGVRMLEPILLLTFASVVALVAAALLQAIYSVRPTA